MKMLSYWWMLCYQWNGEVREGDSDIYIWKGCHPRKFIKTRKLLLVIPVLRNQLLRIGVLSSSEGEATLKMNHGQVAPKMQLSMFQLMPHIFMVMNSRRVTMQRIDNIVGINLGQSNLFCLMSFIWAVFRQDEFQEFWRRIKSCLR